MRLTIKKGKNLSKKELDLMNKYREKEFGKKEIKDFKKDYPLTTNYFFVKDKKGVVVFGLLIPLKIKYLGKNYNMLGIGGIISIKKRKGYGKKLIGYMLNYLKKKGKTGLGFCGHKNVKFYKKAGLNTKKDFIKRFRYKNPITRKIEMDNKGDGIYYNGKDNLIKKILSTKSIVYTDVCLW